MRETLYLPDESCSFAKRLVRFIDGSDEARFRQVMRLKIYIAQTTFGEPHNGGLFIWLKLQRGLEMPDVMRQKPQVNARQNFLWAGLNPLLQNVHQFRFYRMRK
ncbi:hypothetical protein DT070_15445 [Polaromonas sp. SP1]|nr:hypothetical protein DT070_15445 [Polaromonas sp. SP1]